MLIKALCDYYDVLAEKGLVVPEGYSAVPIKYKIVQNHFLPEDRTTTAEKRKRKGDTGTGEDVFSEENGETGH